ncbi:MAG: hypothetical protein DRQ39_07595 [Gammaproteobacteria bacterium]|nr:MAG: hypothetical protein DRQ39_07595 [Gammaproteobacteria bacterium]
MPILGSNSTSTGAIMYVFGYECQEVITCSNDTTVLKSEQFCLMGGEYWSANYKALPAKVDGSVRFNVTITKKPVLSQSEPNCGGGGNCSLIDF